MKNIRAFLFVAICVLLTAAECHAAHYTTLTLTLRVNAINELAVSGNPSPLIVQTAVAGEEPTGVSDSSTYYSITTNGTNKKITVKLNQNTDSGTTLTMSLKKPDNSYTVDTVLTSTDTDIITSITRIKGTPLQIIYKFSATVDAGEIPLTTRTITFTLMDS